MKRNKSDKYDPTLHDNELDYASSNNNLEMSGSGPASNCSRCGGDRQRKLEDQDSHSMDVSAPEVFQQSKEEQHSPNSASQPDDNNNVMMMMKKENSSVVGATGTWKRRKKGCSQQLQFSNSDDALCLRKRKVDDTQQETYGSENSNLTESSNSFITKIVGAVVEKSLSLFNSSLFTSTSHPGFPNPHYMCYMNASLQVLFSSSSFCNYLSFINCPNKNAQTLQYLTWLGKIIDGVKVFKNNLYFNRSATANGKALAERLQFDTDYQHDAHEFFEALLDLLQRDIIEFFDDEQDVCKELFLLTCSFLPTACPSCGKNVSPINKQMHLLFYIDMQNSMNAESIQELVDKNLVEEFEQRCCQQNIKCLAQINCLPEILLIGLKRYSPNQDKISTPLEISAELILAKYKAGRTVDGTSVTDSDDNDTKENLHTDHVYRLVGIVNHIGSSVTEGHYVAYVYSRIDKAWVLCNDHKITCVDLFDALKDSSETCYILVYEAVDAKSENDGGHSDRSTL